MLATNITAWCTRSVSTGNGGNPLLSQLFIRRESVKKHSSALDGVSFTAFMSEGAAAESVFHQLSILREQPKLAGAFPVTAVWDNTMCVRRHDSSFHARKKEQTHQKNQLAN